MSQNDNGAPKKRGRPPKPKPEPVKKPRGRPPKPKPVPVEDGDADSQFLSGLSVLRRRKTGLELNQETLEIIFHCAKRMCSQAECASMLGTTPSNLSYFFQTHPEAREIWDDGLNVSRVNLRSMQFDLAKKNQIMAIFLGKNMLGQKDTQTVDATISKPAAEMTEEQLLEIATKGIGAGAPAPRMVH